MRKNVISLLAVSVGVLTVCISIFMPANVYFLNYREMNTNGWLDLTIITYLALYLFGIYMTALVFQQISDQESEIEPSFLVLGGIIGLLVGSLFHYLHILLTRPILPFVIWLPWVLLSLLGVRIACQFPRRKSNSPPKFFLRTLVPFLLVLTLICVHNSSFPGVTAPAVVRQQWAYKEFYGYKGVEDTIKNCQPIIKRVGSVKYAAPTQGKNYVVYDLGSSGHTGELTLEVVGEKGIGVANFSFHIDTAVSSGQFTYQGRTEEIVCRS